MDNERMLALAEEFLRAWNSQEVERVLECYTPDAEYRDPNTRGTVRGADSLRRYLTKLFATWRMHWTVREAQVFADTQGCAVLWHATFGRLTDDRTIAIDGIDYVEVRDGRIARNEVCFDRAQLVPLLDAAA